MSASTASLPISLATRDRRQALSSSALRELLAEPGGRRRLLEAMHDRLSPATAPDDQQLLIRAHALLESERLDDLCL